MKPPIRAGKRLGMAVAKNGNGHGNGTVMIILGAAGIIMTIFQAFWGVAWSGVNANIDRIEKQLSERAHEIEAVRIREHDRIERQLATRISLVEREFLRLQEHKEFTVRLDSQLSKMEERLKDAATRSELDTRLGINSASIIQVRNETAAIVGSIDRLKTDLGQTYPLKEVLGNLAARIDRMETWSRAPPPHQLVK